MYYVDEKRFAERHAIKGQSREIYQTLTNPCSSWDMCVSKCTQIWIYICKNMYVKLYEVYIWILVLGSRGKCKRAIHVNKIFFF